MEYLLDTSAVLGYLLDEKGAERVGRIIKDSSLPFIVLSELYYIVWKKKGEAEADKAYGLVKSWGIAVLFPNERTILLAARFKAKFKLGIADSYIAAFAAERNLTLATKDPDYEVLRNEIRILKL